MQILRKSNWEGFKKITKMKRKEIINKVKESGLKGRSGSNFLTGLKWELIGKGTRYLICNADEGEPGTFKDKFILENNPQLMIEGIAIASYAMDIHSAFIYLRGEYSYLKPKLEKIIKQSEIYLKKIKLNIKIVPGAGSYLCGEETAILESIEGNRPIVRRKPPYPSESGLNSNPTCINNVETLANIPLIFLGGWDNNLQLFSLSGDLKKPGIYEIELGTKLEHIISCGKPKKELKAVYFGGSGGCLPYEKFKNLRVDEKTISGKGAVLGARSLIAVGNDRNIVDISKTISEFFVHESCGYCTPCREGNFRVLELLDKIKDRKARIIDVKLLEKLAYHISDTSYCALGVSSTTHLKCALKYFKDEFRV